MLDDVIENSGCVRRKVAMLRVESGMEPMQDRKTKNQENSGVMFLM